MMPTPDFLNENRDQAWILLAHDDKDDLSDSRYSLDLYFSFGYCHEPINGNGALMAVLASLSTYLEKEKRHDAEYSISPAMCYTQITISGSSRACIELAELIERFLTHSDLIWHHLPTAPPPAMPSRIWIADDIVRFGAIFPIWLPLDRAEMVNRDALAAVIEAINPHHRRCRFVWTRDHPSLHRCVFTDFSNRGILPLPPCEPIHDQAATLPTGEALMSCLLPHNRIGDSACSIIKSTFQRSLGRYYPSAGNISVQITFIDHRYLVTFYAESLPAPLRTELYHALFADIHRISDTLITNSLIFTPHSESRNAALLHLYADYSDPEPSSAQVKYAIETAIRCAHIRQIAHQDGYDYSPHKPIDRSHPHRGICEHSLGSYPGYPPILEKRHVDLSTLRKIRYRRYLSNPEPIFPGWLYADASRGIVVRYGMLQIPPTIIYLSEVITQIRSQHYISLIDRYGQIITIPIAKHRRSDIRYLDHAYRRHCPQAGSINLIDTVDIPITFSIRRNIVTTLIAFLLAGVLMALPRLPDFMKDHYSLSHEIIHVDEKTKVALPNETTISIDEIEYVHPYLQDVPITFTVHICSTDSAQNPHEISDPSSFRIINYDGEVIAGEFLEPSPHSHDGNCVTIHNSYRIDDDLPDLYGLQVGYRYDEGKEIYWRQV